MKRLAAALVGAVVVAWSTVGFTSQYRVEIDTTELQGAGGAIAFDFTSSTAGDNTATILNFTHDGVTGLPETQGGLVQGDIILLLNPAPFTTIEDGFFFNQLVVPFTSFGTSISFTVQLTETGPAPGQLPDEFSFFVLGADRQPLFMSADPLGADSLFAICLDGTPTGLLSAFDPTMFIPPDLLEILGPAGSDPTGFFLSYKVTTQPFSPAQVTVSGRFGNGTYDVEQTLRFMTPDESLGLENGGDVALVARAIVMQPNGVGPGGTGQTVTVQNALEQVSLTLEDANMLLLPSAYDLSGIAPAFDPNSIDVNHFKCYGVEKIRRFTPRNVNIVDGINPSPGKSYRIRRPRWFCAAVDKNGEGILDPDSHLTCYRALPGDGEVESPPVSGILVENQLGTDQIDIAGEREVCFPSQVVTVVASVGVSLAFEPVQSVAAREGEICELPKGG